MRRKLVRGLPTPGAADAIDVFGEREAIVAADGEKFESRKFAHRAHQACGSADRLPQSGHQELQGQEPVDGVRFGVAKVEHDAARGELGSARTQAHAANVDEHGEARGDSRTQAT